MRLHAARRLDGIGYEIRGPLVQAAARLEAEGRPVIRLNIGDPAAYGITSTAAVEEAGQGLRLTGGYSHAQGMPAAREAVAERYRRRGVAGVDPARIYLGNGTSELVMMTALALLDPGEEVLIPAPEYPLWGASVRLAGGRPVHYRCREDDGWLPDVEELAARVTGATKALVIVNPSNPTGAVWPPATLSAMLEVARRHRLVVLADEIYDRLLYDGRRHTPVASLAEGVPCITYNGLSKTYRTTGVRSGWAVLTGPVERCRGLVDGLDMLASMRLCPGVAGQMLVVPALTGGDDVDDLVRPGGLLEGRRSVAWELLTSIPGVSCVKPAAAFYLFPRLHGDVHGVDDDRRFALDLLREEQVLVVPGTGFAWPDADHFRLVCLPPVEELEEAIARIRSFLARRRPCRPAAAAASRAAVTADRGREA